MCRFNLAMFLVAALWSLHPATRGDEATVPSEGQPTAVQETAVKGGSAPLRNKERSSRFGTSKARSTPPSFQATSTFSSNSWPTTSRIRTKRGSSAPEAEWLANHKPGQSPYDAYDVDDMKIRVYGHTAVVTVRTTPKGRDSKGNPITGQYRYLRVWTERDGQWRAVAFQGTRIAQ